MLSDEESDMNSRDKTSNPSFKNYLCPVCGHRFPRDLARFVEHTNEHSCEVMRQKTEKRAAVEATGPCGGGMPQLFQNHQI